MECYPKWDFAHIGAMTEREIEILLECAKKRRGLGAGKSDEEGEDLSEEDQAAIDKAFEEIKSLSPEMRRERFKQG